MIRKLKEILGKLMQRPQITTETPLDNSGTSAYSEMIMNDLLKKYEDETFEMPIYLINFDALLETLVAMNHPGFQEHVTEPYKAEDFDDLGPKLSRLIADYMNAHLKLILNAVMTQYLESEQIKMSVQNGAMKYYSEKDDEDINGLIELEERFRSF